MTADHFSHSKKANSELLRVAPTLATGFVPGEVLQGLRLGQITAFEDARWCGQGDRCRRHLQTSGSADDCQTSFEED